MENVEETKQYVIFKLDKELYGIDIKKVTTIEKQSQQPITRVPKAPTFVEGVINLRGEIIPVISLRKKFGMPELELSDDTRIIIVKVDDISVGFIVDVVVEVMYIATSSIENVLGLAKDVDSNFIQGVGKLEDRIVTLLNLSALINLE